MYITEIQPVGDRNDPKPTIESLEGLVERPLLAACRILVGKNIRTVCSSANKNDVGHVAYIYIDTDHLSGENVNIVKRLGLKEITGDHWGHVFVLSFEVSETTSVEAVEDYFTGIANQFESQKLTWADKKSFADWIAMVYLIQMSAEERDAVNASGRVCLSNGTELNWAQIASESDGYYDPESGYLYASREWYKREKAS